MTDKIQLLNSVTIGLLSYTFQVYKLPIKLLLEVEQWIRKFVWIGDTQKRGLLTVKWSILCPSKVNEWWFACYKYSVRE